MHDPFDEWKPLLDDLPSQDVDIIACVLQGLRDWMVCEKADQREALYRRTHHVRRHIWDALAVLLEQEQLNKN